MTIDQSLGDGPDLRQDGLDQRKSPRPLGGVPVADGYDVHQPWHRLLLLSPWSCLAVVSPERTPTTPRLGRSLAAPAPHLPRHSYVPLPRLGPPHLQPH